MQEREIIEKLKNKDTKGIDEFTLHYGPLIRYVLSPILSDSRDREECFADITMTVWEKIDTFDFQKGSFTTWLTVISRNAALNKARKQNKINIHEHQADEALPSPGTSPEDEAIKNEQKRLLKKAIDNLSNDNKNLFYRKYYYMQSTAQIAAELGMSERAVEGRLYRIKKIIRTFMGGDKHE